MNLAAQSRTPLSDQLRFLRGLVQSPRGVGAIAPSSPALARAIAAQIDPLREGPVLELGPGTGVVTEAILARGILPERLVAIEYDADFARLLTSRFPAAKIIRGDAFALDDTLRHAADRPFSAIVSGIPLLNQPMERRAALIAGALQKLAPGAPFVQFSYGLHPPIDRVGQAFAQRAALVWRNLPPARVWVYRQP